MDDQLTPFTVALDRSVVRGVRGGAGPTALLIHGMAGSWRNFRHWLPALLPRCHVVIPDLPGFGDSPAPRVRPRLSTWADFLHELLGRLEVEPQILIGLGFGAGVGLAYLQARAAVGGSASLTHLVLHTPPAWPGAIRPPFRWAVRVLGSPGTFSLVERVVRSPWVRDWYLHRLIGGPGTSDEDARLLREDLERASVPVLRGITRDLVQADFRPLLATIECPTLVIVGEDDPFVDPGAVLLLETLMPRARVVVQKALGHGWTPEAVEEHTRLLADFLDRG